MQLSEVGNIEAVKSKWRTAVVDAAAAQAEPLDAAWSNFFQCTAAADALFDLSAIFADAAGAADIEALVTRTYSTLLADDVQDWTLQSATGETAKVKPASYLARPWAEVFEFLGKSFAFAPHCVAQLFEDNHLGLLHHKFTVRDGGAAWPAGRLSLMVAISGGSKSPFIKMTERVLKSANVKQAFADAVVVACRPLRNYGFYSTQGSNLEGLLKHAGKSNVPVGIMSKHEELADTMSKLGVPAKDKLQPRQTITLSNPALTPGKRLGDDTKNSAIEDLKVVLTACVQGNLCFQFLPFTSEGESYRWLVCISPDASGLTVSRSDKLCAKQATEEFLCNMLSTQVLRITGTDDAAKGVDLDADSRALAALLEKGAKASLQAWSQRLGHDVCVDDPMYAYLRGKVDATYMTHYVATWCLSESLLCWLNPARRPQFSGNQVYARMALRRCLLSDVDRRGLMIVNRRAINASPYLKSLILGLSEEEVRERTREAKRRKGNDASSSPQSPSERQAYVWQHLAAAAAHDDSREALVLKPQDYMVQVVQDTVVKRVVPRAALLNGPLSSLNEHYDVITHYGTPSSADANDIEWLPLAPKAAVPLVRKRGQRGGHPTCPAVQFKARETEDFMKFLREARAIFELPLRDSA